MVYYYAVWEIFDGANRFVRLSLCIVERYSSVIEPRASARGMFVARRIMGRYCWQYVPYD
jgi:hypothetical protein